jgi:hypothetical protein
MLARLRARRLAALMIFIGLLCLVWAAVLFLGPLDRADKLSSVLSGFAALISCVSGFWLLLREQSPGRPEDGRTDRATRAGAKSVRANSSQPPGGQSVTGDRNILVSGDFRGRDLTVHGDRYGFGPGAVTAIVTTLLLVVFLVVFSVFRLRQSPVDSLRMGAYTVELQGSTLGGATFHRQGVLRVAPSVDGSPFNWCLMVGNPWAGGSGAVWFGSYGTCFGSGADVALAAVLVKGSHVQLSPIEVDLPLGKNLNAFSVSSSLTANPMIPDRGDVILDVRGSRIEGSINLQGIQAFGGSGRGIFTAQIMGQLSSFDSNALIDAPLEQSSAAEPFAVTGEAANIKGARFTVSRLISFRQVTGSPAFVERARARIMGATFVVEKRLGGSFVYAPPDSRTDLFPIIGDVAGTSPLWILSGRANVGESLASAETTVGGSLDLSGGEPLLRLKLETSTPGNKTAYEIEAILKERP